MTYDACDRHKDHSGHASLLGKIRDALSQRLTTTKRLLELPEDCGVLADRLIAAGFVEKYRRRQNHEGETLG